MKTHDPAAINLVFLLAMCPRKNLNRKFAAAQKPTLAKRKPSLRRRAKRNLDTWKAVKRGTESSRPCRSRPWPKGSQSEKSSEEELRHMKAVKRRKRL